MRAVSQIVPATVVTTVSAAAMYFAYVWLPWHVPHTVVGFLAGFLLLAVSELAPVHTGRSRFRFRMAAQLPLIFHYGLFPVLVGQAFLIVAEHGLRCWRTRNWTVYYPRIFSSLLVPTATAAFYQMMVHGPHPFHAPAYVVTVIASITMYYLLAFGVYFLPGPRTTVHPWQPIRGWLPSLLGMDALLALGAIWQEQLHTTWASLAVTVELVAIIGSVALYTDSSIRRAGLVRLTDLMRDFVTDTTLPQLVDHVFTGLRRLFVIDVVALWILGDDLRLRPAFVRSFRGADDALARELARGVPSLSLGVGLAGFAASSEDLVTVRSPNDKILFEWDGRRDLTASALAVPILVNGEVFGVLTLYHRSSPEAYHRRERELLRILSMQLGAILGSLWRYEQSRAISEVDDLTGVYNYRFFERALQEAVTVSDRSSAPLSLLIIDIDHFKHVNDKYGHLAGNQVLCTLAQTLQEMVRDADTVARYGGEEFTILLPGITMSEGHAVAERIRKRVEDMAFEVEDGLKDYPTGAVGDGRSAGQSGPGVRTAGSKSQSNSSVVRSHRRTVVKVTLSIGVASYPDGADSALALVRHADRAMYIGSKQRGRNRVSTYI